MRLGKFDNSDFDRGRPRWVEVCWVVVQGLLFSTWLPGSGWRIRLLRLFGAEIGESVVIKPRVRVKFPWKLKVGNYSWIGESVWIDNLAEVSIGSNCCISQGAFLCTGSHRWDKAAFDLETKPIIIADQCWVGAMTKIAPGVIIQEGAVLTLGGVAQHELSSWNIHGEKSLKEVKQRKVEG